MQIASAANAISNGSDHPTRGSSSTPEGSFLFDLEGQLFVMEALSSTIEHLLISVTKGLSSQERGTAAALDFAATNLAQVIRDVSDRYAEMTFPNTVGRDGLCVERGSLPAVASKLERAHVGGE